MTETVAEKAKRLLGGEFVTLFRLSDDSFDGIVEGDHDDYTVTYSPGAGLECSCPATKNCSHATAAMLFWEKHRNGGRDMEEPVKFPELPAGTVRREGAIIEIPREQWEKTAMMVPTDTALVERPVEAAILRLVLDECGEDAVCLIPGMDKPMITTEGAEAMAMAMGNIITYPPRVEHGFKQREDGSEGVYAVVTVHDRMRNINGMGVAFVPYEGQKRGGGTFERQNPEQQAVSKAKRNAICDVAPANLRRSLIALAKSEGKITILSPEEGDHAGVDALPNGEEALELLKGQIMSVAQELAGDGFLEYLNQCADKLGYKTFDQVTDGRGLARLLGWLEKKLQAK